MPFQIIRADITTLRVDAIVNAANPSLLGGGGVDGAIHRAAGPALRDYCAGLGGCPVGQVRHSPGFRLPAKWVIHTVGPIWRGGDRDEEALLSACYRNALALALELGCESVAFPLISAGAYGYPKDQALAVAVREIGAFLLDHELAVTLAVYDPVGFQRSGRLFAGVQSYLDRYLSFDGAGYAAASAPEKLADAKPKKNRLFARLAARKPAAEAAREAADQAAREEVFRAAAPKSAPMAADAPKSAPVAAAPAAFPTAAGANGDSLDQRLRCLDESFSQMLLRKIDERGMTDAACYKRANVDRKLFSKIRSDPHYRPSKPTAIAFAVALELSLPETRELLMKAGFALSHSNKFDVIIEYFISQGNYNIFEINEALFAFDQTLLGA